MKKRNVCLILSLILTICITTSCGITSSDDMNANADDVITGMEATSEIVTTASAGTSIKLLETTTNTTTGRSDPIEEDLTYDNDEDEEIIYDPDNDIYDPDATETSFTTDLPITTTLPIMTTTPIKTTAETSAAKRSVQLVECDVEFDNAYFFNEGLCPYQDSRTGLWGYMDQNFNVAIKPDYYSAYCFSDGLAAVFNGDKWGFIDSKGKTVIPFQYDSVEQKFGTDTCTYDDQINGFIDGYAVVTEKSQYPNDTIVINKKGKVVNTAKQETGRSFFSSSRFGNINFVKSGDKTYICNEKLEGVYKNHVPGSYSEVPYSWYLFFNEQRIMFYTDKFGVLKTNSGIFVPYFVVDEKGNLVFDPQNHSGFSEALFTNDTYIVQTKKSDIYRATVYNYKNEEIFGGNYTMISPVCKNGTAMYYIGRYKNGECELLDTNGKVVNVDWINDNAALSIRYLTSYDDKYSDYAVVYNTAGYNAMIVDMSKLKLICNIDSYLDFPTINKDDQVYYNNPEYSFAFIYNEYILLADSYNLNVYDMNGTELGSIKDPYDQYKDFDYQKINLKYGIIDTENGFVKIK